MTNRQQPRSIIVLTREHIGDLVCTTPALRSLRRLYPQAHIAVEVGERAAGVLENNPNVDEIIIRRDHQGAMGKAKFIAMLRRRKFDLAVVLDNCADMSLFTWLGGVPRRAGMIRKRKFSRLLTDSVPFDRDIHEMVDNFRNVVACLGGDVSDSRTEMFPSEADRQAVDALFAAEDVRPDQVLIGLNPGASAPANRWLPERFAELNDILAQQPNTRLLLLGSSGDMPMANEIMARTKCPPVLLTGRLTLLQLAEVLRRCRLVVTGDTGPMHLTVAMGTRVVAVFGPAVPSESGPHYAPGNVVIRKVTGCPNCTKYICRDDRRCMKLVSAAEVAEQCRQML
jgi:lipopolysaccharide heptosyltransferase II